jgi:octaprenyl-diphosphate synthase
MLAADSKVICVPVSDASSAQPASDWKQIIEPVEPFLEAVGRRLAQQVEAFDPDIARYADYALTGQGKHLRAALVALTAKALGKVNDVHITAAVIIEMVHLATLVHDDVMDEAEIRRGRLTLAANWGNETAVLFGDCLFANALKLAASFPTPDVCRAVAAATNTVCTGEIIQNRQRRDFQLSRQEYIKVLEMKTGELFALSCELGAFANGAPEAQRAALRQFGLALGTAYQMYDDCVDVFGSEAVAGKSLGTDLAKGKLTLPVLLFWERASAAERAKLKQLIYDWRPGCLAEVVSLLAQRETLGESSETIHQYLQRGREVLRSLPKGRDTLLGLTEYLARQADALEVCV